MLSVVTLVALVQGAPSAASGHPASAVTVDASKLAPTGAPAPGASVRISASVTPRPVTITLGDDAVSCLTNTYRKLVLVSITKQHLWACADHRQVNSTAVTTGASGSNDATPLGSWRVQGKQRDRYLVGPGYRDFVKYWVPFDGDFGLHDASWQTTPYGSPDYTQNGSHGCVHVPVSVMTWLYRWVRVGQTVVTISS
jgi:lipoprotein-anchoring transpeptidase ErfK/SrfK